VQNNIIVVAINIISRLCCSYNIDATAKVFKRHFLLLSNRVIFIMWSDSRRNTISNSFANFINSLGAFIMLKGSTSDKKGHCDCFSRSVYSDQTRLGIFLMHLSKHMMPVPHPMSSNLHHVVSSWCSFYDIVPQQEMHSGTSQSRVASSSARARHMRS
jgi:hypothetical protein